MAPRLKKRRDFLAVTKARHSAAQPGLVLQQLHRKKAGAETGIGPRVGFTASKKVGNAVARNKAKRRLRAVVEDVLVPRMQDDTDYVLIARAQTVDRDYGDLRNDLLRAMKRLGSPQKEG